ncbi:MAG: PIN domain-containing protein [Candidatus Sulfotelmatobacter sp.]|jgi:PIN domain nuclease of toxin-antitoxin system
MVRYVLDSSAVLRYLDGEAGADRVSEIIKGHLAGGCEAIISSAHWGEIAGQVCKRRGRAALDMVLSRLAAFGIPVAPVDADRAVRAALIRLKTSIPYGDAFGVELAADSRERVFVTADFDFKVASREVKIEFLPVK